MSMPRVSGTQMVGYTGDLQEVERLRRVGTRRSNVAMRKYFSERNRSNRHKLGSRLTWKLVGVLIMTGSARPNFED